MRYKCFFLFFPLIDQVEGFFLCFLRREDLRERERERETLS